MEAEQFRRLIAIRGLSNRRKQQEALAELLEELHGTCAAAMMAADFLRGDFSGRVRFETDFDPEPHACLSEVNERRFMAFKRLRRQGLKFEEALDQVAAAEGVSADAIQTSVTLGESFLRRFPDLEPD